MRYLVKYEEQPAEGVHLFGLFFAAAAEIKALRALEEIYLGERVYGLGAESLATITKETLHVVGPVAQIAEAERFVGGIDLREIACTRHPIPAGTSKADRKALMDLGWDEDDGDEGEGSW